MTGDIEDYVSVQAEQIPTGSVSFGRFHDEPLSWERRSTFSHNKYLEEVEKYSQPGSVTQKKAYFEAHFKKKGLMQLSSSDGEEDVEYQTNKQRADDNDQFRADSVHDDDEYLQSSWYEKTPHALDDREQETIDYDEVTCNEKEVTTYHPEEHPPSELIHTISAADGVSDTRDPTPAPSELPHTQTETEKLDSDVGASYVVVEQKPEIEANHVEEVQLKEKSNNLSAQKKNSTSLMKTSIASGKKPTASQDTSKRKVQGSAQTSRSISSGKNSLTSSRATVPVRKMESGTGQTKELKQIQANGRASSSPQSCNIKPGDSEHPRTKVKEPHRSGKDINARKISAHPIPEKSENNHHQLANSRPKRIAQSANEDVKKKGTFTLKIDERAEKRKEFYMKLEEKHHAKELALNAIQAKAQEQTEAELKQLRKSLNFKATPMPSFYKESSGGKKLPATAVRSLKIQRKHNSNSDETKTQENSAEISQLNKDNQLNTDQSSCTTLTESPAVYENINGSHIVFNNNSDHTDESQNSSLVTEQVRSIESETKEERVEQQRLQQKIGEGTIETTEAVNEQTQAETENIEAVDKAVNSNVNNNSDYDASL